MQKNCSYFILCRPLLFFMMACALSSFAQNDSLQGFDFEGALKHARHANNSPIQEGILEASKRQFINQKYFSRPLELSSDNEGLLQRSAGYCDNIGFENGNTSGWSAKGDYSVVSSGVDPFGKFPKVYPGGKYSLQLNNNTTIGKGNFEASATRLINVTSGSNIFNLRFAFVILNFPHDSSSAARFRISLRDSTKHADICADYNIYYEDSRGPIGTSNFSTSVVKGINTADELFPVTYAPWQTVSIDLSAYAGRAISIKVSCDWCVFKVDWAYCYIDGDCSAVVPQVLPCMKFPGSISGPPGLSYYRWLTPQGKTLVTTTRTLAVNSAGTYVLHCNQTSNCNEAPFLYKYQILEANIPSVNTNTLPCSMAASYSINNPLAGVSYTYIWQDATPPSSGPSVTHVYKFPGLCTATLKVKDASGCTASMEFNHLLTSPVTVSAIATDLPGKLFGPDDFKTYEAVSNYAYGPLLYEWTGDNYSVRDKYARVNKDGVYIVKATDVYTGCKDTAMVIAELHGWIPTIFTPNNDGMNDLFRFRYKHNVVLRITNRWGHLVLESKDVDGILSWDGTTEGNQSSDGVYFYTITSVDPNIKGISGNVTLLR